MSYNHNPYIDTSIGSDGRRYSRTDPNIPTTPSKAPGRGVTQADLDPVVDAIDALETRVDALETP